MLCIKIQVDKRETFKTFKDTVSSVEVIKGRYRIDLGDIANFCVLCQVGRFTNPFCY